MKQGSGGHARSPQATALTERMIQVSGGSEGHQGESVAWSPPARSPEGHDLAA